MEVKAGDRIFNVKGEKDDNGNYYFGTLGGVVYDLNSGKELIITCLHSVLGKNIKPENWRYCKEVSTLKDNEVKPFGKIIDGKITNKVDIAIIKPYPDIILNLDINNKGIIKGYRQRYDLNIDRTNLWKFGAKTNYTIGKYNGVDNSEEIDYPNWELHEIRNLLLIKNINKNIFSLGGDSGSIILDFNNNVVGVLVASNIHNKLTFIIRVSYIINRFNIKFIK